MSELRVKTTIVFEAEYYIDTDFYESDNHLEIRDQEQRYVNINPDAMIDTLKHRGNFCGTVELMDEQENSQGGTPRLGLATTEELLADIRASIIRAFL